MHPSRKPRTSCANPAADAAYSLTDGLTGGLTNSELFLIFEMLTIFAAYAKGIPGSVPAYRRTGRGRAEYARASLSKYGPGAGGKGCIMIMSKSGHFRLDISLDDTAPPACHVPVR